MIHKSALISKTAVIGKNVAIGPFTTVHDDVVLGDDSVVEGYCEIGVPSSLAKRKETRFGNGALIRSHSIFYAGCEFGAGLMTGHRVTVRENTIAGKNLQIGTLCDFQGDCEIGDHVRTLSNAHIGKKAKVGDFVWIYPWVVLTNDPHPPSNVLIGVTVEDYAVIATMSVVLPGITVGSHSLVAAHSLVNKNVEPGKVVGGTPAKVLCNTDAIKIRGSTDESAYPWPRQFHRGYPDEIVEVWKKRFK